MAPGTWDPYRSSKSLALMPIHISDSDKRSIRQGRPLQLLLIQDLSPLFPEKGELLPHSSPSSASNGRKVLRVNVISLTFRPLCWYLVPRTSVLEMQAGRWTSILSLTSLSLTQPDRQNPQHEHVPYEMFKHLKMSMKENRLQSP